MTERRVVEGADGALVLRPQEDGDTPFLARIFAASRAPSFLALGLPPAQVEQLVGLQHRAQTQAYRQRFPDAGFWILERDGEAVGRYVEDAPPGALHVVDIAVAPERHRRGLARAVLAEAQARAQALGLAMIAEVAADNGPSLALFEGLGFARLPSPDGVYIPVRWG
ncbi:MAG TPA: GNAT family N-acetyltransferase [Caulobacteraceae bacterium]|nr:GNAT family N-acetyltransferase [Caulobacteraceae bacterium]